MFKPVPNSVRSFMKSTQTFMEKTQQAMEHNSNAMQGQNKFNMRVFQWLRDLTQQVTVLEENHKSVLTAFENQNTVNRELLGTTETLAEHLEPIQQVLPAIAQVVEQTIDTDRSQNEAIKGLIDRLSFLETMLKDNEIHETNCQVSAVARHNARGMSYMHPQPCNCWLSTDEDDLTPENES